MKGSGDLSQDRNNSPVPTLTYVSFEAGPHDNKPVPKQEPVIFKELTHEASVKANCTRSQVEALSNLA